MLSFLLFLLAAQDPFQLGRQAIARGELDEAEAHLEQALASNPPRVFQVHYALGRLYLLKRDYPRALEAFEACLSRAPRFAPALVGRARASIFLGSLDSAEMDLIAAEALPDPPPEAQALVEDLRVFRSPETGRALEDVSNPRDYLHAGAKYVSLGNTEDARRAFRVSQSIDDQNPISFQFLKRLGEDPPPPHPTLASEFDGVREALEKGRGEEATSRARAILERRPLFVPARLLLLEAAEKEGRFVDALVEYEELLSALPAIAALFGGAARVALSAKAYELAQCGAARALELSPGDEALFFLLAEAQLGGGKADEAIATCERAIASGIATAPIYFTLGNALHAKMEITASIDALRKSLELDPQAAENVASFALSSLTTEDHRALRSLLEAHAASHPANLNTLYALGVMHLREGELEKARHYLERVRELAPRDRQAHYNLALVHQRAGREDLARESMARFQELQAEDDRIFQENRRRQDLRVEGRDALARGELERAIEAFAELVKTPNEETPSDYAALGEALFGAGRLEEARAAFEKALVQRAEDARALEGLSRVAAALGDEEDARRCREAVELLGRRCP